MNAAKSARLAKQFCPADFCPAKGCLWRVRTRDGVKPCPKHAPHEAAPDDATPVLTRDELELIRARVAGGTFDDLDAGALLGHIDAIADSYEDLVQRGANEADRVTALILTKDEEIAQLHETICQLREDALR